MFIMRNIYLILLSIACCQGVMAQKNIAGTWEGKLSVATTSLRIVVHIKEAGGEYTATMDSPDQGAKGIPVTQVTVANDSLLLDVAAAAAKLSGRLTSDSTFSGQWQQGGQLPLLLKKITTGNAGIELRRPQTPSHRFPTKALMLFTATRINLFNMAPLSQSPKAPVLFLRCCC